MDSVVEAGWSRKGGRIVFHVDMDAFFASIEQKENSHYRGKPLIVGGVESGRGVVSAASYEARVFGIHSAMPVSLARQKCPHGIFIPCNMELYRSYSKRVMDCLMEFSPVIEQLSVDEAFLDMTGGCRNDPTEIGAQIKTFIQRQLGLTASVGMAANKFLAKLASDFGKPNGLTCIAPGHEREFLDPLPVDRLWGVGKKTMAALHQLGLYTFRQIRLFPLADLKIHFGESMGSHIHFLSQGEDDREVSPESREKSISAETTFETDLGELDALTSALLELSDRVARRARKEGLTGRTISLIWRDPDFSRHSRSRTLTAPTHSSGAIYALVRESLYELVGKKGQPSRRFRLLGVRLSGFGGPEAQLSLFDAKPPERNLDVLMDAVRDKFGEKAISRGRLAGVDPEP